MKFLSCKCFKNVLKILFYIIFYIFKKILSAIKNCNTFTLFFFTLVTLLYYLFVFTFLFPFSRQIFLFNYAQSNLSRQVKLKKRYFEILFLNGEACLTEKTFIVHYLDTHVNKYVFLSFMSLLLKRASVVSDRPDIASVRRRRINTRDVHLPVFLSLSLPPL